MSENRNREEKGGRCRESGKGGKNASGDNEIRS